MGRNNNSNDDACKNRLRNINLLIERFSHLTTSAFVLFGSEWSEHKNVAMLTGVGVSREVDHAMKMDGDL